jgi:hypothetical protein
MHLGEPLRVRGVASPLASTLASGYPLHHLRAFHASRSVARWFRYYPSRKMHFANSYS